VCVDGSNQINMQLSRRVAGEKEVHAYFDITCFAGPC
jgi:hypothetical protein